MSQAEFLLAIAEHMGCPNDVLSEPGITIAPSAERVENRSTAGYQLGSHLLISCEPKAEPVVRDLVTNLEPTLAAWETAATDAGAQLLGAGRMQLHADPHHVAARPELAPGFKYRSLDRNKPHDVALVAKLIEVSDASDLDYAEIDIDNLDEVIEVVLDPQDQIAAYGSSIDFDMADGYGDIGVMTRADCRGSGLGSSVVRAVCERILDRGQQPLYRCDEDNVGSIALSNALGFAVATKLSVYRFDIDQT